MVAATRPPYCKKQIKCNKRGGKQQNEGLLQEKCIVECSEQSTDVRLACAQHWMLATQIGGRKSCFKEIYLLTAISLDDNCLQVDGVLRRFGLHKTSLWALGVAGHPAPCVLMACRHLLSLASQIPSYYPCRTIQVEGKDP